MARKVEKLSTTKARLKVGDRVRKKGSRTIVDVVEFLPGMKEYDQYAFLCAEQGMILKENHWDYQSDWQVVPDLGADAR